MPTTILLALLVATASTRASPFVQDFESTYPGQEFAATPEPDNATLGGGEDLPSPTPDGTETVDQSPTIPDDASWESTVRPSPRISLPYILRARALSSRGTGGGRQGLGEIALGPVEISSLLHQIMTSPSILGGQAVLRNLSSSSPPEAGAAGDGQANDTDVVVQDVADDSNQLSIQVVSSPLQDDAGSPYLHWDSDSEEQEREMEEQQRLRDADDEATTSPVPTPTGRSYLLLLAGNSTIVQLRQRDFAKYLKLNLAARLSLEYDDVRVNRVVLAPPRLLVNVSVVTPSDADPVEEPGLAAATDQKEEAPLHMLAETNATLLELSGEEYHVVRLLSLRGKPPSEASDPDTVGDEEEEELDGDDTQELDDGEEETPPKARGRHDDIELVIYTVLGGACAVVVVASAMVTVARYTRNLDITWPWKRPKHSPAASWGGAPKHYRMADDLPPPPPPPPKVIYSGVVRCACRLPPRGRYAGLGVGGSMMMGWAEMEAARAAGRHRVNSPSKLHIFSCRPGSVLIPLPPPSRARVGDVHPLDVRIQEDLAGALGHDNPSYRA